MVHLRPGQAGTSTTSAANPRVESDLLLPGHSWVAVTGTAAVVDDLDKLRELWNTFAEAWLPGGPEDPNAVLIHVDVDAR